MRYHLCVVGQKKEGPIKVKSETGGKYLEYVYLPMLISISLLLVN